MRIQGVTIPEKKRLEIGLTTLYGVGRARAHEILEKAGIDPGSKPNELTPTDTTKIQKVFDAYTIEGDLKRVVSGNIKRLKDIKSNRGMRHARNLPLRGQRTRVNARTVPSGISAKTRKRATMGSGKRKVEKK